MSKDNRDIFYAAFFFCFGIFSFFKGFMTLRRKRLIESTPTSTVRGFAMGLVELTGKAKKTKAIKSPFTGVECVFYRYTVERYESSGRSSRWVIIGEGNSNYCPFWLDDGTGKIMVFPEGAELVMPLDYEFTNTIGKPLPDNLIEFMESNGLKYKTIFGDFSLRFKEWFIEPGESVYVLGTTEKTSDSSFMRAEKLLKRLQEIKNNPESIREADSNNDGMISRQEWDAVTAKIERELIQQEIASNTQNDLTDVVINKGDTGQVFIISDRSQSEILKSFSWQCFGGVFGGAALSVAALVYLWFRLFH